MFLLSLVAGPGLAPGSAGYAVLTTVFTAS